MKTANNGFRPICTFKKHRTYTKGLATLLTIVILNLVISCNYYNVRDVTTSPETIADQIKDFNASQNYAIIHSGENIWNLDKLVLNEDDKTISGVAQHLNEEHISKKPRAKKKVHRYKKLKQQPFNELHFNINKDITPGFGTQITIPFSDILSLSINDKNSGRSILNAVAGTIGIIAVVSIIAAAVKGSCPFIYVNNGEEFIFTGELYPGIITANQERDDYLSLPNLTSNNDEYNIKITNELKEIQHTDLVELIVVEHPENVTILMDKNGLLHSFSSIIPPNKVMVDHLKNDITPSLKKDNVSYLFNSEMKYPTSLRNLELEFDKPAQSKQAKLFVTVKNSMWLDYVFGKFNAQFGTYYDKFQKDQQFISKEKSTKWMNEQNIPISVYIKTTMGWELVDKINTVGPMATRDIVVPIDINNITSDKLEIKLETGFMFWEVDYVGIDYTENLVVKSQTFKPFMALDQHNIDVTSLLANTDQKYFVQPNIGDEVTVTFKVSEPSGQLKQSFYLKNRGYYNYIRNYTGKPNFNKLKLFKEAGAFTDFSKYEYEALMDYDNQLDMATINN